MSGSGTPYFSQVKADELELPALGVGLLYSDGTDPIGIATAPEVKALVGATSYSFSASVNFNASGDTAIPIVLPTGFTRYEVASVRVSGASIPLSAAEFGVYTGPTQGGVTIAAQTLTGITATASDTANNAFAATVINPGVVTFNDAALYVNVGTIQGAAATASVTISLIPLP